MPLRESMLQCACRISSVGDLLGTGFLITVKSAVVDDVRYGYVVTARHVVASPLGMHRPDAVIPATASPMEIAVETGDPSQVGLLHEPVEVTQWRQPLPGVDLAIAPWPPAAELPHIAIELEQYVADGDVIPAPRLGDHIYYLGVFQHLDRMMARSGTIGALNQPVPSHPGSPLHLVDCRSYDGFSGSPCFADIPYLTGIPDRPRYSPPGAPNDPNFPDIASFQILCGMFIKHFSDEVSSGGLASRYGVGMMIRSEEIRQALMTPEAIAERRRWDEQGFIS